MFGLSKREKQAKRVADITDLAGDCQAEIYINAKKFLNTKYGNRSGIVAAAIANYIMHFGMIAGDHSRDPAMVSVLHTELGNASQAFTREFRQNILGTLILFAAVERKPLESFKAHLRKLAELKFFELGSETPNVTRQLDPAEFVYMHEAAAIKP